MGSGALQAPGWRLIVLFVATFTAATALARPAPAASAAAPQLSDASGLHIISIKRVDARLLVARVSTRALPAPANIDILLPAGYAANPGRRYPVLYLLHGTSGGASDWTTMGDAERTTESKPVIVVMPDIALGDNGGGWCTNWFNAGAGGVPEWETFHIDQVIPWVDQNLRTVSSRAGRAIAGLSQGGFCSTSYAARHPDLFSTVLSYSGAPDIAYDAEARAASTPIINATEVFLDGVPINSMFGDRAAQEINWAAHDPATLAENLRGMNISLYTGNGQQGPFDSAPVSGGTGIEGLVSVDTQLFHSRINALAIPSYYDAYGPGTHTWPYWARDLKQSIDPVMTAFAHPPAPPASVTYTSAEFRYAVFGWQVIVHRTAKEFSTLKGANAAGFSLAGSGTASVVTPPLFTPGASYGVTLKGDTTNDTRPTIADSSGRLQIEVPLGPANTYQQYTAPADAMGTRVYKTHVAIDSGASPGGTPGSTTDAGALNPGGSRGAVSHSLRRRACASRRSVTVRLHVPRGARAKVRLNGRATRAIVRQSSISVSLVGRRAGTYRLLVVVRYRHAGQIRTLRLHHRLHTCRPARIRRARSRSLGGQ